MNDKKKQAFEQLFSTLDGRHEINGAVLAKQKTAAFYIRVHSELQNWKQTGC